MLPAELGGAQALQHGVSITDACINYTTTRAMLSELNKAVHARWELLIAQGIVNKGIKKSSLQCAMKIQHRRR